jgi:hypothetical protein
MQSIVISCARTLLLLLAALWQAYVAQICLLLSLLLRLLTG